MAGALFFAHINKVHSLNTHPKSEYSVKALTNLKNSTEGSAREKGRNKSSKIVEYNQSEKADEFLCSNSAPNYVIGGFCQGEKVTKICEFFCRKGRVCLFLEKAENTRYSNFALDKTLYMVYN